MLMIENEEAIFARLMCSVGPHWNGLIVEAVPQLHDVIETECKDYYYYY